MCRELGIGVLAYSPLGRGILTGQLRDLAKLDPSDFRRHSSPWFAQENLESVSVLTEAVMRFWSPLLLQLGYPKTAHNLKLRPHTTSPAESCSLPGCQPPHGSRQCSVHRWSCLLTLPIKSIARSWLGPVLKQGMCVVMSAELETC